MPKDEKTLRAALQAIHAKAMDKRAPPYMSIPADAERDADLILEDAITELVGLRASPMARIAVALESIALDLDAAERRVGGGEPVASRATHVICRVCGDGRIVEIGGVCGGCGITISG